jgi:hypothetical protein
MISRTTRATVVLILAAIATMGLHSTPAYGDYLESFQTWSASSNDTWQTKDLSGAPFNVPADAVVEVAVRNANASAELWGGVRAVGSSLERRFQLHEAEAGGWDVVVMHVQADGSSQIQHYSDDTGDVDFILLGYWDSGIYTEAFQSFTSSQNNLWNDHDLSSYGVGSARVAEVVLVNTSKNQEGGVGVRANGSSLSRILDIHEAEPTGVDTATLFVQTDPTANATIEVYTQNKTKIEFYLVGYWSTPPESSSTSPPTPYSYTELFTNLTSPTADATWEDEDLSSAGVPADAVAEFALVNTFETGENNMGVRANGSSLARLLDLHETEIGGGGSGEFGRIHVTTDASSTIEFYHEDVSDAHEFRLTGYWSPKIRVVRWREVRNPPAGACCLSGGGCLVTTQTDCTATSGTYQGDGTRCDPCP